MAAGWNVLLQPQSPLPAKPIPYAQWEVPVQLTSVREATDKEEGGARTGTMDG